LDVAVGLASTKRPGAQSEMSAHSRLVVAVGATVWYCEELQTVSSVQLRSDVRVGAVVSKAVAGQLKTGVQAGVLRDVVKFTPGTRA
jgi:hypothetical protein